MMASYTPIISIIRGVALVVAISLPLGYGVMTFRDLSADLQFKAQVKATAFSSLIASNPELWIYAENQMQGRESLRQAITQLRLLYRDSELPSITVSIGVAAAEPGEIDAAVLLSRADVALYQAKHQRRNRIVVSESSQA